MGKVEKISIALTDELLATVKEAVASGDYASNSEVLREALREWRDRQREKQAIAKVRALVAEADASGYRPFPGVEDIKERGRARLRKDNSN
ncbi:ribbon-helix-helix domain-containing protein [Alterisphingorhabdus coralli]|uniref:Type II toxin-antitoxin system ParD family antitoxin n=1 Tax=Alterisphingorhabdus coralli TaxID=3071408 RepID=A0AA97F8V5_9SPHN|nr:type II toxin-antitoxin system ParD family antitoxin [Parasphingorhabdus sp. SCSIO 66989]WOE76604.1 type II toxin-antitoxin system ParD family antitoxin [Parasphingorhabdus sp. SCSIO 66989]